MAASPLQANELIRVENASVCYRAPKEAYTTFKEYAIRSLQGKVEHSLFWALKDVSLSVNRGEVFGLVGRNGAGKSTLLKLVARVMRPTTGRVVVGGRVAPLLEVGAGFHPDLTGRENVYLNGAILGLSRREMERLFPSILDFSEIGDFIDAPLRTFSSGMVARLGFSVATAFRPDVLIVDEILGVGDEAFQNKCYTRITQFREQGTTILLVSHNSSLIASMCDRAALLEHGGMVMFGPAADVVRRYCG